MALNSYSQDIRNTNQKIKNEQIYLCPYVDKKTSSKNFSYSDKIFWNFEGIEGKTGYKR